MFHSIEPGFKAYMLLYTGLSLICFVLIALRWRKLQIFTPGYWRFIFTLRKFGIYVVGTLVLLAVALSRPYPYWNVTICLFQPVLAYLFAPWSVAVFCKRIRGEATTFVELYIAICLMMIAAAWAVEVYVSLRDGFYMTVWFVNHVSGIVIYCVMGLLWNLNWKEKSEVSKFWLEP